MKKILTMLAVLTIVLLASSCMKDMPDSLNGYSVSKGVKGSGSEPTQESKVLKSSVENLSFSSYSGNQSFAISSNTSWTISSDQSWCTVGSSSGSGSGTVTVRVSENTSTYSRTATITVRAGDISQTITVTQSGATPVDQSEVTFSVNGVSFKMIRVKGGTFTMGKNYSFSEERPAHSVTVSTYYIGETEVTQELWQAVMGDNPSIFIGSKKPVNHVSWNDCQDFVTRLNSRLGQSFRMPTEAEWEFAARGGNNSRGYEYAGSDMPNDVAWYWNNSGDRYIDADYNTDFDLGTNNNLRVHDVKTKMANELGIYDMSGNVEEWCQDFYGYYSNSNQTNPTGPTSGSARVFRGGSFGSPASAVTVTTRFGWDPSERSGGDTGLRLAL